jgi:hypothetical protein
MRAVEVENKVNTANAFLINTAKKLTNRAREPKITDFCISVGLENSVAMVSLYSISLSLLFHLRGYYPWLCHG